ncbi:FCPB [Symbiodinium sp. CCMP2592]|nr:FCPB [Symbiodinium sp. CCMP2592]
MGLKFADVPNGLAAISKVPAGGWTQILLYMGWCEVSRGAGSDIASGRPGDFGWYVLTSADAEEKKKKLNAELANGRLAMMAIIGMFYQDGLTGSAWGDWANYTESPLRAAPDFTQELGVTPPLGFFDPLGLSKYDNDEIAKQQFRRRRIVELQHGRVAMLACIGYIVPEYVRFPGFCAPSQNLAFTDIPNGLKGAAAVPLAGWLQIITFVGIIEVTNLQSIQTDVLGDYGYGAFGLPFGKKIEDAEKKAKSLNAEINNGRLAMMAIIGMFFQDGLTGSAWGDWANYTDSPLRAAPDFSGELGVTPPLGFFDPLGLSKFDDPQIAAAQFKRRRIIEIQHGRVAMLACIGYIVPEYVRFPGFCAPSQNLAFTDIPNGLKGAAAVPLSGWLQIITFVGIIEVTNLQSIQTDVLGDYGYGAFGLPFGKKIEDAEKKAKSLNAEINNGRLAMFAIIGMFFQDGLTGSAWGDWANYTESPLRAFEEELGVQAPVGFWDPVGYTRDGNVETFKRRRETEIKHGRVAMYATMGYIVPEYFKWPGFLSPSLGLKFSDVPNGLAAITKVPGAGWAQIVAFAGYYELFVYKYSGTPGDYGWKILTSSDPEGLKKKLSAEIANGRLAMMAIIGMFFQDGLTGSAWGDWANYTDSPLRAFEDQPGVQPPVGFWDPLGLSASGNVSDYNRRREVELKHGRVCMFATIGYILPEYWRFPGYLSKYLDIKFSDVPNGLNALSKVPAFGWLQIVGFAGIVELNIYNEQINNEPGNYGAGFLGLRSIGFMNAGIQDPETRKKKLNAELANGRLAMFAIIGMFFQDGLTGSAWGDWANYTDSPLRAFEDQTGVQPPVGFWDPLGLSQSGNVSDFNRRREVELKHGRVSMFATIGYILPEYWRFPGYLSKYLDIKFADVPNGLSAFSKVPAFGWLQIVGFAGIVEVNIYNEQINSEPGNYGAGFLGLRSIGVMNTGIEDPETRKKKLNAELANGRLAMMAIIGMFFQDGLTGSAWGDWANYTASPLRAFEEELGVQPPVGFWDPVGYTRDGSVETFKRRRETEIKHGRVAMYATMGYIVPEYFKWPGFLSPSLGLKFSDVPNGLAAISKVPGAGWAQIVAFAGYYELFVYKYSGTPGDYGWKPITSADPEGLKKKLSAELANGRLAMMAIIGMFFQDGLTGSAWGDWANYTDSPLRAFEDQTGVQPPVGFWDPLGLSASGNVSDFKRRREVELKHGRVAMFATIGYILPEYWRFPGYLSKYLDIKFADVPNGLSAFSKVPAFGWLQIVGFAGIVEVNIYNEQVKDEPGNYGAGFLGLRSIGFMNAGIEDPETRKKKLNAELANGRLAMFAIIGMFFQDGLTGSAWGDWSLYTASPLRAFEGELGVQAPVGFWDPLGLSADGDAEVFKRRREVELKHGRISMFATIGYIVPEYFRWPGELSPKLGLKFTDIPNGLAALTKVPGQGWGQIVAFLGTYELFINKPVGDEPGNYGKGNLGLGFLPSVADPEARTRKLSAELANGRLAMMAIIGMLFQDGLTGSAWGDWALYTDSPLRAFEQELGAQPPLGFWDPVGFTKDGSADNFKRRRAVEIKHGRVAMLATMGYITPEIAGKWGGICATDLNFSDIPNGLAALKVVPFAGWLQIFAYCGFVEFSSGLGEDAWGSKKAGDVGWKPPFFSAGDDETKKRRLAAELANGRLAMMAIIGMFFQDGLTGSAWGDWANYTASPLRAFEQELGAQPPLGFWDPVGFTKDGSADNFKRRRAVEIKHGRVAMLATMGYITPEIAGKWGGICATDLNFSDIPNGLAALKVVPFAGWLQIFAYCGFVEFSSGLGEDAWGSKKAGDVGWKPPFFSAGDDETKKRRLAAELANGRLAMMAIIGMFFQDGLTGSAWGDWANYTASPLRAFEQELGAQPPLGFWDPVGFTKDGSADNFKRRRAVEIKHGRVAMLATMGYITPEIAGKWGGICATDLNFSDIPNGLAALKVVPFAGWLQIFAYCGFVEFSSGLGEDAWGSKKAGDVGWKPPFFSAGDDETKKRRLAAELANGRLAMMAIIGMFFQDGLTGSAWGDWANYTASPLRAFEGELGVQAPVGFWDPLGLSADGDMDTFKRRRAVELKHGRICMLACVGYIIPEYFRWPGYLSPEKGLKFSEMPHGIAAISKVPLEGWLQIVLFIGHYEGYFWRQDAKRAPGDFEGYGFLGVGKNFIINVDPIEFQDADVKKTKLAAELANGRLAMVALMAMLFQNGTVGTTGPAMWLPSA